MVVNLNHFHTMVSSDIEKFADKITAFSGTMKFLALHLFWFVLWIGLNLSGVRFDPFPFGLLTMIVSLEAIILSTFVMISQNRANQREEHRADLEFELNVKEEQENKMMIEGLAAINTKLDEILKTKS